MLPAAHRLRSAADFRSTTRRGVKAARGSVVVYVDRVDGSPAPATVGLIVPSSVGGSVVRHRVARRLRASARPLLPLLPPGTRVVLRALPGADRAASLPADVESGIRRGLAGRP